MDAYKKAPGVFWAAAAVALGAAGLLLAQGSGGNLESPIQTASPEGEPIRNLDDIEAAIQVWEDTLAEDGVNAQAHYQLGLLLAVSERGAAPGHLEQAKALDPALAEAADQLLASIRRANLFDDEAYQHILIGQTLGGLGEWDLAEAAFTQSVRANPAYAEAWAYLGEARQQTGEDGLSALEKAIELDPESSSSNLLFNLYWRRQERPDLALSYAQTAVQLDPGNFSLIEVLARTYAEDGNFTEAVRQMQSLAEMAPEDAGAWLAVAEFCLEYEVQVEETGIPAARQAVVLNPEDPAPLALLGEAYLLSGDDFYAERFLNRALRIDPEHAAAHLSLGILALNLKNYAEAYEHLQAARRLGAGSETGARAEDILQQYFP